MQKSATILERDHALAPPPALAPGRTALFLDLDGTLAHIAARPEAVGPQPRRTRLLKRLAKRLGGRLAVISGRSLEDVDRILEDEVRATAAVHGLVRRNAAGSVMGRSPHPGLDDARVALEALEDAWPGLLLEDKRLALALHYRNAPQAADLVVEACRRLAGTSGLTLQLGQMVAELRTPGPDKGDSVRAFMNEAPFAAAMPVFVGDDLTDEDGFAAAHALGGFGVLVGPPRETAARYGLPDVEAVLAWLEAGSEAQP